MQKNVIHDTSVPLFYYPTLSLLLFYPTVKTEKNSTFRAGTHTVPCDGCFSGWMLVSKSCLKIVRFVWLHIGLLMWKNKWKNALVHRAGEGPEKSHTAKRTDNLDGRFKCIFFEVRCWRRALFCLKNVCISPLLRTCDGQQFTFLCKTPDNKNSYLQTSSTRSPLPAKTCV